jgi:hypothetical protein
MSLFLNILIAIFLIAAIWCGYKVNGLLYTTHPDALGEVLLYIIFIIADVALAALTFFLKKVLT